MSAASDYLEGALLDHLRGTQLPLPSNFFVSLFTSDPTDAGTGEEVSTSKWPAYKRQSVGSPLSSAWTSASPESGGGKQITNANAINFPANDGSSPVVVTHFALFDAQTGGNMWVHAPLTAQKTIDPTDIFSALPGSLRVVTR